MPIGLAPTVRSTFEAHTIDHAALDAAPMLPLPFSNGVSIRGYSAINQPNCQIIVEDFMPGDEFDWVFTHDEMQYCLSGEMELTVYLPPLYSEVIKTKITAGTLYSYPVGARKHVKVTSDVPVRHICFCPPSPNYPFQSHAELVKSLKKAKPPKAAKAAPGKAKATKPDAKASAKLRAAKGK
jgi:quercetin dioxygenase-like cupin family protein